MKDDIAADEREPLDEICFEPPAHIPENMDWGGAQRLTSRLRTYWVERGYISPLFSFEQIRDTVQPQRTLYAIKSDMVNGLPREKVPITQLSVSGRVDGR